MSDPHLPAKTWLSLFMRLGGQFTILLAIAGVLVCVISVYAFGRASQLDMSGVEAMAHIDKTASRSRNNGKSTYEFTYSFQIDDGSTLTQVKTVSSKLYLDTSEGDILPLRYDPADPSVSEIEPGKNSLQGLVALLVGIGMVLLGAGMTWFKARRASLAIRTRDTGRRLQAEVTELREVGDKRPKTEIHWRDQSGTTGKSMPMPVDIAAQYPVGSSVTVFSDAAAPKAAFWQGDVGEPRGI